MKKLFPLAFVLLCTTTLAQKFDRESLSFQNTHLPSKLIYDQIKTYGSTITVNNNTLFALDNNFANGFALNLTSYNKVDVAAADLKLNITFGPYMYADEKFATETREEKKDSVTKKVTYYKRVLNFKYPISYKIVNGKNSSVLYTNEFAATNIRTVATEFFASEAEALKNMNDVRTALLSAHINELCNNFVAPCNNAVKDMFDFYDARSILDIYKVKKWDRDDEYNAHVKTVMVAFKEQTAATATAVVKEKIKEDIIYFESFNGVFKPKDKKEDILYFINYYNLSTIYFCLDDFEKAKFYIQKMDSSDKQERNVAYFKSIIKSGETRTAKHLLTTTHLDYNPVKEFKLAGKNFITDAGEPAAESTASTEVTVPKVYVQTGNNKRVLNYIWLAYQCWSTGSNTDYSSPDEYIYSADKKEIIGQKFLYPVYDKKYVLINLNIANTAIPTASYNSSPNNSKVFLTWTKDKLTGIKIDGLSGFDYTLNYEKDTILTGFTSKEIINGTITTSMKFEMANNQLSKITRYENKSADNQWIRSIKTFTYNEGETLVDCITYGTNRPNTQKGIVSTLQGIYKKSTANPYIVSQPYGESTEASFNSNNDIEKKIIRRKMNVEEETYFYNDGKLCKKISQLNNIDGSFKEKTVGILVVNAKPTTATEEYEKTTGTYKFDVAGDMIYEARDSKYRQKVNGVWSEWKNFRY